VKQLDDERRQRLRLLAVIPAGPAEQQRVIMNRPFSACLPNNTPGHSLTDPGIKSRSVAYARLRVAWMV